MDYQDVCREMLDPMLRIPYSDTVLQPTYQRKSPSGVNPGDKLLNLIEGTREKC